MKYLVGLKLLKHNSDYNTFIVQDLFRPKSSSLEKMELPLMFKFLRQKTSFFYKYIKKLNLSNLLIENLRIKVPYEKEYRGKEKSEEGFLVGFTPPRNKRMNRNPSIREYNDKFNKVISEFVFDKYYEDEIGGAIHAIFKVKNN